MMWASKVSRSTMAAQSRGSVKVAVHSLKAALDAMAIEARSSRSVKTGTAVGAAPVEFEVAQFVQAQQVSAAVAGDGAGQGFVVGGLDELVDQRGGGDVPDPVAVLGGGGAQPDQQVGLAGAGVADEAAGLPGGHPGRPARVRISAAGMLGLAA